MFENVRYGEDFGFEAQDMSFETKFPRMRLASFGSDEFSFCDLCYRVSMSEKLRVPRRRVRDVCLEATPKLEMSRSEKAVLKKVSQETVCRGSQATIFRFLTCVIEYRCQRSLGTQCGVFLAFASNQLPSLKWTVRKNALFDQVARNHRGRFPGASNVRFCNEYRRYRCQTTLA